LERIVKSLGFKWRKCQSKREILIDRADIVVWRSSYLVKIKEYREKGHPIFCIDESWVDSNPTFRKFWQNEEVLGVQTNVNSGHRLIMLHVEEINGFLPNAALIYKAGSATGVYHGQMNAANFEKLAVEKLILNLPAQSEIVLDKAPYRCLPIDKPPSVYKIKADMISWLGKKGVNCNETMRKN
jgi:hypothetical protein